MSHLRIVLALLACLLASPALAGDQAAPAQPDPTAETRSPEAAAPETSARDAPASDTPAPAEKSDEERAIEAMAVAFRDSLVKMQDEMVAAYPDGDMEAIVQPRREEAIALSDRMGAFLKARTDAMEPGPARDEAAAADADRLSQVRRLPDVVKGWVLKGLAASAATATPEATAGGAGQAEAPAEPAASPPATPGSAEARPR